MQTTPSLGSWDTALGGQSIFVKLTPAALQAYPAAMTSLLKTGITMDNYLERYHAKTKWCRDVRYMEIQNASQISQPSGANSPRGLATARSLPLPRRS